MEALLDEIALALEDILVVGIEADDEARQHPEPTVLNDTDLLEIVLAQVLKFLGLFQADGGRRLDADKHVHEVARTMASMSSGRSARSIDASV